MENKQTSHSFRIFSIILFCCLFVYLSLRVFLVEPIHDELATLFNYVDYGTIIKGVALDANNHLLNSFLSKIAYSILGDHIWAIRLPNLFSFILYFWAIIKLSAYLKINYLRYLFLVALTAIPYFLDYFAYTRGYGLSMAFLMVAVYYFIRLNEKFSVSHMMLFSLASVLGLYANLNLVITIFLMFGYLFIQQFIVSRKTKQTADFYRIIGVSTVFLFAILPAIYFALQLRESGALYYGTQDGLWATTGATLSEMVLFTSAQILKYIFISVFLILVVAFIRQWLKIGSKSLFQLPSTLFFGLFFGNIIAIELMRWIMDVNYPEDRVGMHLIPLFIGVVFFMVHEKSKFNWITIVFVLLPFIGWKHFNFKSSIFSPDDRIEQQDFLYFLDAIEPDKSSSTYQTQQLAYAHHVRKNNPLDFVVPNQFNTKSYFNEEIVSSKFDKGIDYMAKDYTSLRKNPRTFLDIVKRNREFNWKPSEKEIHSVQLPYSHNNLYYNFIDTTWTGDESQFIKVKIECEVNTPELQRETLVLVVDKETEQDSIRKYDSFVLNWASGKNRTYRFKKIVEVNTQLIPHLKIYLYNPNNLNYTILNQEIQVWEAD